MGGINVSMKVRDDYVLSGTKMFALTMHEQIFGPDGVKSLEDFLKDIDARSCSASRKYTTHVKNVLKNNAPLRKQVLDTNAEYLRTVAARIALLKGYVEALKIKSDDGYVRTGALHIMGYLRSQCEAMERCIL